MKTPTGIINFLSGSGKIAAFIFTKEQSMEYLINDKKIPLLLLPSKEDSEEPLLKKQRIA